MGNIIETFSTNNFLIVNKDLIRFFKCANTAVFFSYLINNYEYFSRSESLDKKGYFYIRAGKIKDEIFMSYHQQKKYLEEFESLGLIDTALRGYPAKKHVKFNLPALELLKKDIDTYKENREKLKEFEGEKRKKSKDFFKDLEDAILEENRLRFEEEADKLKNKADFFNIFINLKKVFGEDKIILNRNSFYKVKTQGVKKFENIANEDTGLANLKLFKKYLKLPRKWDLSTEDILVKFIEFDTQMRRIKEIQNNAIH